LFLRTDMTTKTATVKTAPSIAAITSLLAIPRLP
jgi:hypothetical protein